MLKQLEVERFKSLVELRIDLGRVNLFIGANGSGKSNILEALGVLGAAASGRVDDESLNRRGVRPGTEQLYKSAFPELSNVPHIKVGARTDRSEFDVTLWNPAGKPGAPWGFKSEQLLTDGNKVVGRGPNSGDAPNREQGLAALKIVELDQDDPALQLMNHLRGYAIHDPNTPALRGLASNLREPVGLDGSGLAESIDDLEDLQAPGVSAAFAKARGLIDWARDFKAVVTNSSPGISELLFEDRFMAAGRNLLTARDASEGALYVLYCMVLAVHPKAPACLALDNLGQALNPRLARRLMLAICEWTGSMPDRQWLVTAHNPAVLDGLPLQDPTVRLFAVDRTSRGHTVVRRIDLDAALEARPGSDWTLSRMWMTGLLGAVPNV